jgi:hypothetical protein
VKTNLLRVFALLFFVGAVFTLPVRAQTPTVTGFNIITSPLPINLITSPGTTVSTDLRIKNSGTQTEIYKVGLMKFDAYGEEGKPRLMDRGQGDDYFDWVSFSPSQVEVAPNEWKTVTMTIKVPETAAFGYYYAVTFSRADDNSAAGPRQTTITGATASLVLLEVRVPQAVRQVEVLDFSTDHRIFEFLPVSFRIRIANKGNVHVAPRGNIFVSQGSNKNVALLEVNPEVGNILPNSNRIFTTKWSDGFPVYTQKVEDGKTVLDSSGNQVYSLNWDFSQVSKLRWGKYTADLLLVYDDGVRDQTVAGQLTFWVMPWRLLAVGLVIVVLAFAGIRSIIKDTWKKFSPVKPTNPS